MAERPNARRAIDEPELERGLAGLARHIAYPVTPDLATRVRQELALRPAPSKSWLARSTSWSAAWLPNQRRLAFALVALILLAGAVLAISPEARTAVAERLGLRGVSIREVPPVAPTAASSPSVGASSPSVGASSPSAGTPSSTVGARLSLGQLLTLDQARARVAFQIPLPTSLGPPDEIYVLDTPPGGQVALVYLPRPGLPQANTTGVGLLLTAFQGTVPTGMFGKGIPPGTRLEELGVNGGHGYWIEGDPHTLFLLDNRGQVRTETTRLAGNVLLWEHGALTLRIESTLSKDAMLAIASSVR